jgi:hypothetical protein
MTTGRPLARGRMTAAVAAAMFALASPASAQSDERSRSDSGVSADRDFGGTWERYPAQNGSISTAPGAALPEVIPPPPIPPPPLRPEFQSAYETDQGRIREAEERGEPLGGSSGRCLPQGMPTMMTAVFPIEILQTRGQVTIVNEAFNQIRRIYIGAEPVLLEDAEPVFAGHSTARWDGDSLVVDTVGIKEYVKFRNVPHSNQMRIRERLRVLDASHFEDEITLTDPTYLTGPWTFTFQYQRKPEYRIYEYVCEDNREFTDPKTGALRLRLGDTQ